VAKGTSLGNLSANGALSLDIQTFFTTRFSLFAEGDWGSGGSLAFEGGDGTVFVPITVTSPYDGAHSALVATLDGIYTFEAVCHFLRFTLSLATNPDLNITLFAGRRP